ncbi:MAG: bestrophin-like domain [Reyranella sp.]
MMTELNDYPLPVILAVSLVVILGASEIGRWLGVRSARYGEDSVATLEGAILGLLALMIGFTFAMALSRFEARRDALLNEANAIGTTALRARLLPAPHNTESVKLLREYVQRRLDVTSRPASSQDLRDAIAQSNRLQEALWQQAKAVAAKDNAMVPTGIFIQALNEMIDDQEKRLTALYNRLPLITLIALYGVAVVAVGFAGYASGQQARHSRLPVYITGILVASMILLIQDLDRPGAGFIRVSQQPMIDTAAAIAAYPDQGR